MSETLERRVAAAGERVRELSRVLSRDTMDAWRSAREDVLKFIVHARRTARRLGWACFFLREVSGSRA